MIGNRKRICYRSPRINHPLDSWKMEFTDVNGDEDTLTINYRDQSYILTMATDDDGAPIVIPCADGVGREVWEPAGGWREHGIFSHNQPPE